VVIDALADPVYAKVYTSEDVVVASGTMASPWGVASGDAIIVATLNGFFVAGADTPNDGWYLRFESGSRYVDLSFGLSGSAKEAVWSLPAWTVGTQAGITAGEITVTGNRPPAWSGAPATLSFTQGAGGTTDFSAYVSDPDDDTLTYSLVGTSYTGISIGANSGVLTVTSSAAAAVRALTIRATDSNGLYADHACSVTIVAQGAGIKWNPGFYIFLAPTSTYVDSAASRAANLTWFQTYANDPNIKGVVIHQYIRALETGTTTPSYNYVSEVDGVRYGGFACIDYYLGLCATYNKRLAIVLKHHAFSGATALPTYWVNQGWEHRYYSDFNSCANIGISACRDRYIALIQAYGARYDTNPRLEWSASDETTVSLPAGITSATWISNYKAILSAAVVAWPTTMFRSCENGQLSHVTQREVYEHIETLNNAGTGCVLTGGPDHEDTLTDPYNPGNEKPWQQLWRGETTSLGVVWKDVRGQMPRVGETQERGYSNPNYYQDTAANILTYQIDYMESSHVVFLNYNKWTETLAAITARSGLTDTTVPTCLTGRTVTGGT
jgi:hypothetical protein